MNQRAAEPKNYIWKQSNNSLVFPKTKRFSENWDLPQTRIKEVIYHLRIWMNIWWKAWVTPKPHLKTIKSSLQEAKNQISFSNRCTFKSTAVLYLRINSTSDQ